MMMGEYEQAVALAKVLNDGSDNAEYLRGQVDFIAGFFGKAAADACRDIAGWPGGF